LSVGIAFCILFLPCILQQMMKQIKQGQSMRNNTKYLFSCWVENLTRECGLLQGKGERCIVVIGPIFPS
jgi:hypothetical protein